MSSESVENYVERYIEYQLENHYYMFFIGDGKSSSMHKILRQILNSKDVNGNPLTIDYFINNNDEF